MSNLPTWRTQALYIKSPSLGGFYLPTGERAAKEVTNNGFPLREHLPPPPHALRKVIEEDKYGQIDTRSFLYSFPHLTYSYAVCQAQTQPCNYWTPALPQDRKIG